MSTDGLTDQERLAFLHRFIHGMGAKPSTAGDVNDDEEGPA